MINKKLINKKQKKKIKGGFTLIELLLYIGVVVFIISGVTSFSFIMLQARVKTQVMSEINYQGQEVINLITQAIRNSEGVNNPTKQLTSSNISIDAVNSIDDPTIFDISGGKLVIQKGSGGSVALTNDQVTASNLIFQNNGPANAPDSIHFEFQLNFNNLEGRNEYDYSKTFYGTASVRK